MTAKSETDAEKNFSFLSSIAEDVWHPKEPGKGFEWWYFDALNEDATEAVVIIFLDNFIFSPRYNSQNKNQSAAGNHLKAKLFSEKPEISELKKIPAVVFIYYKNGKPLYRAINEFSEDEFFADSENPECRIANNFFNFRSAPYGKGYNLSVDLKLRKNCRLKADFEWLGIESDFLPQKKLEQEAVHNWNLVSPRSDVSGKIVVKSKEDKEQKLIQFRGTGYHDHNLDTRWLPETINGWHWGRAHFVDSTAVFYRYKEIGKDILNKLAVVSDGRLKEKIVTCKEEKISRDKFGLKYPQTLIFKSEDNLRLIINQTQIIDSSFFYLRFLSEMILELPDGQTRHTIGITEYLAPKTLKYRWLDWLVNMRIGRNGKGSFLP